MSVSVDSRGGILGWFKSLFGGTKQEYWEDRLQAIIFKLNEQERKLDELYYRMQKRAQELFERTVEHLKKASNPKLKPEERRAHENLARTFAEEVYEIRAFLRAIKFTSIAINKAALRLQTVRDMKDFQEVLLPVSQLLAGVKNEISGIFPNVGEALDEINKSIAELMIHTSSGVHGIPSPTMNVSKEVDEILNEAWNAAVESVDKNIPEPSKVMRVRKPVVEGEEKEETKQTKPLKVYIEHSEQKKKETEQKEQPKKEVKKEESEIAISTSLANASMLKLEQLILDEIRVNKGRFNIGEFVEKYGFDRDKVFEALQSLSRKGKIRVTMRRR